MKSRAGATLLEMLTGLFVFSLLSGVVLSTFVLSHRYLRESSRLSELQRSASNTANRLGFQIAHLHHSTLQVVAGEGCSGLSSLSPDGSKSAGAFSARGLLWQQWQAIWRTPDGELVCAGERLTSPGLPFSDVDGSTRAPFAILQTRTPRVTLGHHVVSFQVETEGLLASVGLVFQLGPAEGANTQRVVSSFPLQ